MELLVIVALLGKVDLMEKLEIEVLLVAEEIMVIMANLDMKDTQGIKES